MKRLSIIFLMMMVLVGCDDLISVNRIPVAKLVYTEEYIDGSHTVLFRDGRFVIFTQDTLSGYRVYIDSMDMETGTLSEDGGIIVQCDYNLKPMYAVRQDICYFFYDYKYGWNENSFRLLIFNEREDYFQKVVYNTTTKLNLSNVDKARLCLDALSTALATGGNSYSKTIDKIKEGIIEESLEPKSLEHIDELGGIEANSFVRKSRSAIMDSNTSAVSRLRECAEEIVRKRVGENAICELISTETVSNYVTVKYRISGTKSIGNNGPKASVYYKKSGYNWAEAEARPVINDAYEEVRVSISPGKYEFKVLLYPSMVGGNPFYQQYCSIQTDIVSVPANTADCFTGDATEITAHSAVIHYTFSNIPKGARCYIDLNWSNGADCFLVENREGPQSMSLSGLTPGTKYNYCTRMTVPIIIPELGPAETDLRGNDRSFTTLCDDISPDI